VESLGDPKGAEAAEVINSWVLTNDRAACQWVDSLVPGPARDSASAELVNALREYEPASAWEWAGSILDDGKRLAALKAVALAWRDFPPEFQEACAAEGILVEGPEHPEDRWSPNIVSP
jgi:hypothetical protein